MQIFFTVAPVYRKKKEEKKGKMAFYGQNIMEIYISNACHMFNLIDRAICGFSNTSYACSIYQASV